MSFRRRIVRHLALLALVGASSWLASSDAQAAGGSCLGKVTGYASSQFPGRTADGTPTLGNEWTLVAVDPRLIPLGSVVAVEGLGVFRAADTGAFRGCWVDVLVYSVSEAYSITGTYSITWW